VKTQLIKSDKKQKLQLIRQNAFIFSRAMFTCECEQQLWHSVEALWDDFPWKRQHQPRSYSHANTSSNWAKPFG